jgi:cytochrome c5
MLRIRYWLLLIATASLLACSAGGDDTATTQEQQSGSDYPEGSWRARYLALGQETYVNACAFCHDEGKDGAPVKGDRETWSNRSPLWSAVLLEHAKGGYLQMPVKGGQIELSDRAIEAAGEYMLNETFPELPRD